MTTRLLAASLLARLPLAALGVGLLVHTQRTTGSFASAGAVTGAYALAGTTGGPLLARLADRRGQTRVLLGSASAALASLVAIALLPQDAPVALLAALAAAAGLASPPVGACVRAVLPDSVGDAGSLQAAYAFESSALELTFIAGPPLVLGVGSLWSTGAALAVSGALLFAGTVAFAAQPASRRRRSAAATGGSLRAPAMRTLVVVLTALGVVFGATELGVTAAAASAAPLLALWGAGSLGGGVVAARFGGGARTTTGLALVLAALALGHLSLAAVSSSTIGLAVLLFVAGAAIAPTYASVYALVDDAAPAGTITEAFAWLATATAVGAAGGAAVAGALVESAGPGAAFVLAGVAGAVAVVATLLRSATLPFCEAAVQC
jgi:MFS family permease